MGNKKTWVNLALGLIGLVIIVAIFMKMAKPKTGGQENSSAKEQSTTQNQEPEKKPSVTSPLLWEGTLQASVYPKRGNLLLMTKTGGIYIHTNRDYSTLIGKQVVVTYQGTADNFVLGDIMEKSQSISIPEPK